MEAPQSLLTMRPIAGDAPEMREALAAEGLALDDLAEPGRVFFRFEDASGQVVGYGGYEPHGDSALVRSIVVAAAVRDQGFGKQILTRLLERAKSNGARRAYLITESAQEFFEGAGFAVIDRASAPKAILATKQATLLCSETAPLMAKSL
jgi:N-acetylglutamate synthase-like GNAT family acetyltransferase